MVECSFEVAVARHHYLPQFYLQGFANNKKQTRVYRTGTTLEPFIAQIRKVAAESGFYEAEVTSESGRSTLEAKLSQIEGDASRVLSSLTQGRQPSLADRALFAFFLGLQMMRTPEQRIQMDLMTDVAEKALYENITKESAKRRLAAIGIEPTDVMLRQVMDIASNPNAYFFVSDASTFFQTMLTVAGKLAVVIADQAWVVGTSPGPALVTGDHAFLTYSRPTTPPRLRGTGLGNAEQVHFPLDRYHLLTLLPPGSPEGTKVLSRHEVDFANRLVAASSHRYVFQHPSDPRVDRIVPKVDRPVILVNQRSVFAPSRKTTVRKLRPIFLDHAVHSQYADLPDGTVLSPDEVLHFRPPQFSS